MLLLQNLEFPLHVFLCAYRDLRPEIDQTTRDGTAHRCIAWIVGIAGSDCLLEGRESGRFIVLKGKVAWHADASAESEKYL